MKPTPLPNRDGALCPRLIGVQKRDIPVSECLHEAAHSQRGIVESPRARASSETPEEGGHLPEVHLCQLATWQPVSVPRRKKEHGERRANRAPNSIHRMNGRIVTWSKRVGRGIGRGRRPRGEAARSREVAPARRIRRRGIYERARLHSSHLLGLWPFLRRLRKECLNETDDCIADSDCNTVTCGFFCP